ncbi:MAG TPA: 2'-5' RNA ligase family protein [Gaiellaceae bacterium]|nr:2'-5' RNA ligase family protein [Gaiellaceae bacterium]
MAETALLIPVPEAAPHVDGYRSRFTPAHVVGLPPHVTLLYPFVDGAELTAGVLRDVERVVAAVDRFEVTFRSVARLEGPPPTLYLVPEPAAPFAELTRALVAAFPAYPPYGGRYEEIVPHLTVATADAETLAAVAPAVSASLPLAAPVVEAWLMQCDVRGRWHLRRRFALR